MRLARPQERLDCLPITQVKLNLNCRDEIAPILRALQHLYEDAAVRGDTFVVETNIHYPTESALIGDGLRRILPLAAELAAENGLEGWRQHEHVLRKVRKLVHAIGRASRAQGRGADRLKPGYRKLVELAEDLLARDG